VTSSDVGIFMTAT